MALSISRLIRSQLTISPLARARRGFGTLMLLTDDTTISGAERLRSYTSLEAVGKDLGTNSKVYQAAMRYYGQKPKPLNLMVGRMVSSPEGATLVGGQIPVADQDFSYFSGITDGAMTIPVDGNDVVLTALDFSAAGTLYGVASIISTRLGTATATWDGSRMIIRSKTSGTSSSIGYARPGAVGTDVATLLALTSAQALPPQAAIAAESLTQAVMTCRSRSGAWFGLALALEVTPAATDVMDLARYVEAASPVTIFGVNSVDSRAKQSKAVYSDDIGAKFAAAGFEQCFATYSQDPFAHVSVMGRAFSVNFSANRSTITLMYKQLPGVVAETLSETEAQNLESKRYNVFAEYDGDIKILQTGVMSGTRYFDEAHGLAWFEDAAQNAAFNALYARSTKLPQTEEGVTVLINALAGVCREAVNNGLAAPGVWQSDSVGQLVEGDYLTEGFYIYAESIDEQDPAERAARKAPPIIICLKLAGAIHSADLMIRVNR